MREQVVAVERFGAGGGEDGDEDAEPEGAAELVGDVDEPGGRAGVFGRDAGDAGGGEGEDATEHEAEAGAHTGNGAVVADRAGGLVAFGEARRQEGKRRRGQDCGADALQRAGADQPGGGLRQADGERCGREERDPDDEHPAPPEDVARPRAEQQQPAERERVRVPYPREPRGRAAEALVHPRERSDDDRMSSTIIR